MKEDMAKENIDVNDKERCLAKQAAMYYQCGCPRPPPASKEPGCSICPSGMGTPLAISKAEFFNPFRDVTCQVLDIMLGYHEEDDDISEDLGPLDECSDYQDEDTANCNCNLGAESSEVEILIKNSVTVAPIKEKCSICYQGDDFTADNEHKTTFDDNTCGEMKKDIEEKRLDADDDECRAHQSAMFYDCGCKRLPPEPQNPHCSLCPGDMSKPDNIANVDFGDTEKDVTCRALDFVLGYNEDIENVGPADFKQDCEWYQENNFETCGCVRNIGIRSVINQDIGIGSADSYERVSKVITFTAGSLLISIFLFSILGCFLISLLFFLILKYLKK